MDMLKDFIKFISGMRSLWASFKSYTLQNRPTGAQMTSFLEQNADPRVAQAIQHNPEWQAAKRSTVDNQAELRNAAINTAQNKIPVLQGKSPHEIEQYIADMAHTTGFMEGGAPR